MSQSQEGGNWSSQSSNGGDGFCTPKQFRNRRVNALLCEEGDFAGCKTPPVQVPPSPAMKRIGYGTGTQACKLFKLMNVEIKLNRY